jgi:hypothetical protein
MPFTNMSIVIGIPEWINLELEQSLLEESLSDETGSNNAFESMIIDKVKSL